MAKCEKCYHNKVCINGANYKNAESCIHFKDKELIAELHHGEWKTRYDFDEKDYYCSNCGKKL